MGLFPVATGLKINCTSFAVLHSVLLLLGLLGPSTQRNQSHVLPRLGQAANLLQVRSSSPHKRRHRLARGAAAGLTVEARGIRDIAHTCQILFFLLR